MHKVKIRLPAAVVNFGPGLNTLGLALSMYTTVEISPRSDQSVNVDPQGEGAGRYPVGLRHPVVLALARVFQRLERAPLGFNVRIDNHIPVASGLGAETAFLVAGVIGANNLMGSPFSRDQALEIAAQISRADSATTAMLGGLTASFLEDERLYYRSLPVKQLRVVVALPDIVSFPRPAPIERVPLPNAIYNLNRLPLLMEALADGDLDALGVALNDSIQKPRITPQIPAYSEVTQAAFDSGAVVVSVAGDGPAVLAFAETQHHLIAEAMRDAFKFAGITARAWVVPIDTQGLVLSVMQTSTG